MDETETIIETFRNPVEAKFLQSLLRDNGVPARVVRPKLASSMARMTGGHAVVVRAEDAGRAQALLETLAREAEARGDVEAEAPEDAEAQPAGPRHEARWLRWLLGLGPRRD